MNIYPVIHYLDRNTTFEQVGVARACGADGVFLINHGKASDAELVKVAHEAKQANADFRIGINLLSESPIFATLEAIKVGLDMVWADDMGVDSSGLNNTGLTMSNLAFQHPEIDLFASVAFKYRPTEPHPSMAAEKALRAGFIPTTSGAGTGLAPEIDKIERMSSAVEGRLAIASGMSPYNVAHYAGHLSYILVATGVAIDAYRIAPDKLNKLIDSARAVHAAKNS